MNDVRAPVVAGQFYPADAVELAGLVDALLADTPDAESGSGAAAYIAPHAGYRYSGPTAAYVYKGLRADRVILLGPSHFAPLDGAAVPTTRTWRTPVGQMEIDREGCDALVAAGLAVSDDRPHAREHSLEVQLPFLRRCAGTPRVLPIAVGPGYADGLLLGALASGPAVVICSTDLSHYLSEAQARARDSETLQRVLEYGPIGAGDACGLYALRALLAWASAEGLAGRVLHRATSADAGADPHRVVGYAAVAFSRT